LGRLLDTNVTETNFAVVFQPQVTTAALASTVSCCLKTGVYDMF